MCMSIWGDQEYTLGFLYGMIRVYYGVMYSLFLDDTGVYTSLYGVMQVCILYSVMGCYGHSIYVGWCSIIHCTDVMQKFTFYGSIWADAEVWE